MSAPADPYFIVQQIDRQYAIYASADRSLVLADIETPGDARNHILDLIAADERADLEASIDAIIAEQQAENAHLADFDAQAVAMAYGPAVASEAA